MCSSWTKGKKTRLVCCCKELYYMAKIRNLTLLFLIIRIRCWITRRRTRIIIIIVVVAVYRVHRVCAPRIVPSICFPGSTKDPVYTADLIYDRFVSRFFFHSFITYLCLWFDEPSRGVDSNGGCRFTVSHSCSCWVFGKNKIKNALLLYFVCKY